MRLEAAGSLVSFGDWLPRSAVVALQLPSDLVHTLMAMYPRSQGG